MSAAKARRALDAALAILVVNEAELGRIDAVAGDGDHGAGMVRGFRAADLAAASGGQTAGDVLTVAGGALGDAAGGASGALWGVLLGTVGMSLRGVEHPTTVHMAAALKAGLEAIEKIGRAQVGDKTLIDALDPFVSAFEAAAAHQDLAAAWESALPAARAGRDATVAMVTRRGRAAALGEKSRGNVDPGAYSLCLILEAVGGQLL